MTLKFTFMVGAIALVASSFAGGAVYTESGWGANDYIDWGQFGADGTSFTSGVHGTTANGIGFTLYSVADNGGLDDGLGYTVFTEGSTWAGTFNPGDRVLYHQGSYYQSGSDVAVIFDQAIGGFGSAGQSNAFGDFNLAMGVYDNAYPAGGNVVGFAATSGTNPGEGGNYFLGYVSDTNNIVACYFNAQMVDGSDDLGSGWSHTLIKDNATPEPASMAALGLGVAAFIRRRRAKKA